MPGDDDEGNLENEHLIDQQEEEITNIDHQNDNGGNGENADFDDGEDLIPFDNDNEAPSNSLEDDDYPDRMDDDDDGSVRALTLKDDVDYDNPAMIAPNINYENGYNEDDDLNNDGVID